MNKLIKFFAGVFCVSLTVTGFVAKADDEVRMSVSEQEVVMVMEQIQSILPEDMNALITYTENNFEESEGKLSVELYPNPQGNLSGDDISIQGIGARTKCTYIDVSWPTRVCPVAGQTVIARAWLARGTPSQACKAAKKSANNQAPLNCQAKHCSPCTYY